MKVVLLLCTMMACAMAHDGKGCSILHKYKVKGQWSMAFGTSGDRETIGLKVWKMFFIQSPDAASLFQRVNGDDVHSPDFTAHIQRVLGGLDMAICLLDDEPTLNAELAHLKSQHDGRGINDHYFPCFKTALMKILQAELGKCFDSHAWSECLDVINSGIDDNYSSDH